jgi:hypothetical protein
MTLTDDDITAIEAYEVLRPASDYLLQLAACGQIDLNKLARSELRARLRYEATCRIAAMAGSTP